MSANIHPTTSDTSKIITSLPGKGRYDEEARRERLEFLSDRGFPPLDLISRTDFEPERLRNNLENFVGAVDVPIGLAGPLLFKGGQASGAHFLPMATTEGALVASTSRGSAALSRSGGIHTQALQQRVQRVPVMSFTNIAEAMRVIDWLPDQMSQLRSVIAKHSRHARLVRIDPHLIGRHLYLEFIYQTGDAAGQNMVTICSWESCLWLIERMKAELSCEPKDFVVESHRSSDKKLSHQSFQTGRGIRVVADCQLSPESIKDILKTTPDGLFDHYLRTCESAIAIGMIGANVNVANVVAAAFTATGQDIACVHESSVGQLHISPPDKDGSLYVSLHMPSLVVGTVGGGTGLPRQKEALRFLECEGDGTALRLAEIICGFALALDLSTSAAMAAGHFARAHEAMGRNRPDAAKA